ncbi:MAG: DHH family phosphoesterase [Candidatus Micrarchaeota archaeon]
MREASFLREVKKAGVSILKMKNALVVHHDDADGIAAAAIIIKARQARGLKTRTLVARYNTPPPSLLKEKAVIFVDFGATLAKEIDSLKNTRVVVLDHHALSADKPRPAPRENLFFVNPGDFKLDAEHAIDGGQHICGASMAFHALKHSNVEGLAALALVGAAGDMQLKKGALEFNRDVVEHGVSSGEIFKAGRSLNVFDSHSPLFEVVANFLSPALPGLVHNEDASKAFLSKNGFDPQKKFVDMTPAEQENLTSVLEKHAWQNGLPAKAIAKMRAEKFSFPQHASLPHAFREPVALAGLLNACSHLPAANEEEVQRNAKKSD